MVARNTDPGPGALTLEMAAEVMRNPQRRTAVSDAGKGRALGERFLAVVSRTASAAEMDNPQVTGYGVIEHLLGRLLRASRGD